MRADEQPPGPQGVPPMRWMLFAAALMFSFPAFAQELVQRQRLRPSGSRGAARSRARAAPAYARAGARRRQARQLAAGSPRWLNRRDEVHPFPSRSPSRWRHVAEPPALRPAAVRGGAAREGFRLADAMGERRQAWPASFARNSSPSSFTARASRVHTVPSGRANAAAISA